MMHYVLVIATFYLISQVKAATWHYGPEGSEDWVEDGYPLCNGNHQSPIDIDDDGIQYVNLGDVELNGYETAAPGNVELLNNGHTIQANLLNSAATISGGGLPATYKLEQFHFHWGGSNDVGSEHTLDGDSYPMELHLVHYENIYSTIGAAVGASDHSLAVLGFVFEISDSPNDGLQNLLVDYFLDLSYKDDSVTVPGGFSIFDFLGVDELGPFYRYSGSLTTPPCAESVVWTVYKEPLSISQDQLDEFRSLYDNIEGSGPDHNLENNYRPTQPLNGRTIISNDVSSSDSSNDSSSDSSNESNSDSGSDSSSESRSKSKSRSSSEEK